MTGPIRAALEVCALTGAVMLPSAAIAHPHIFVDAIAQVSFDTEGRARSLHNVWSFDEAYSSFAIQGLDKDGDGQISPADLQPLAEENVRGLSEYGYYSSAAMGGHALPFLNSRNAAMTYQKDRVTLSFDVDFAAPVPLVDTLELGISDPQYYVAIQFAGRNSIRLVDAPQACGVELQPPRPLPVDIMAQVQSLPADVTTLPADLQSALRGSQGAILVNCGTIKSPERIAEARSAIAAIDAMIEAGVSKPSSAAPAVSGPGPTMVWWGAGLLGAAGIGLAALLVSMVRSRQRPRSKSL